MFNNPKKEIKIRTIAKKLGITDIGETAGYYITEEDEKRGIKTYLICDICGGVTRVFLKRENIGMWCFDCELILYESSQKRICEKLEIKELFTKKDREFFKKLEIEI